MTTVSSYHHEDDFVFVQIYRRYYVPMINYARSKTGDIEVAEDLVQALFADLYLKTEFASNIEAYLFTALKRRIFNYWRHQDVRTRFQAEQEQLPVESATSFRVEIKDIMKDLYNHVAELPPQCQRVFHLKKAEYTNKEIATELNISVKTVEAHFTKALSYLRKNVEYPFTLIVYTLSMLF